MQDFSQQGLLKTAYFVKRTVQFTNEPNQFKAFYNFNITFEQPDGKCLWLGDRG